MARSIMSAATVVETTIASTSTKAELLALSSLPLVTYKTANGEERVAVRLHSLSYLPERVGEDGETQTARFGGFVGEMTDPATGEVRGLHRDSIPLQFFGRAAEELRGIIDRLDDPKRDAVLLAVNGDPATLYASVHRDEEGRMRQLAVGTREFSGKFKKLVASPPAVIEEE